MPLYEVTAFAPPPVDHPMDPELVPLRVGVYFGPTLLTPERSGPSGSSAGPIPFVRASAAVFEVVLAKKFRTTVIVPGRPPLREGQPELDAVIEASIEAAPRLKLEFPGYMVRAVYGFKLWDPAGELMASWTVEGQGRQGTPGRRSIERAAQLAVRDAGNRFAWSFDRVAELRDWLERVRPSSQPEGAVSGPEVSR
jgi:hypothetical protein